MLYDVLYGGFGRRGYRDFRFSFAQENFEAVLYSFYMSQFESQPIAGSSLCDAFAEISLNTRGVF